MLFTPDSGDRPHALRLCGQGINKNKKPDKKTIRARNYFLGSFGSPCSFSPLRTPRFDRLHPPASKC
ncbi:hypothetical protein DCO48_17985 [Pseudomonas sp. SDI]|nr:hypothetical protein DCO48_17985 [Pseudomonas sp. SDI]